jgi:hypothetical protein
LGSSVAWCQQRQFSKNLARLMTLPH